MHSLSWWGTQCRRWVFLWLQWDTGIAKKSSPPLEFCPHTPIIQCYSKQKFPTILSFLHKGSSRNLSSPIAHLNYDSFPTGNCTWPTSSPPTTHRGQGILSMCLPIAFILGNGFSLAFPQTYLWHKLVATIAKSMFSFISFDYSSCCLNITYCSWASTAESHWDCSTEGEAVPLTVHQLCCFWPLKPQAWPRLSHLIAILWCSCFQWVPHHATGNITTLAQYAPSPSSTLKSSSTSRASPHLAGEAEPEGQGWLCRPAPPGLGTRKIRIVFEMHFCLW